MNLHYELARAGRVQVSICDLRGRLVRTLVTGHRAAGSHATAWRGRDDAGREVASEVYLAIIETRDGRSSTPISLVR